MRLRVSPRRFLAAGMAVGIVVGLAQSVGMAQSGKSTSPLIGVWRVAEVTTTGPNARKITNPQPGLLIVTAGHYANERVTSDAPRPELPPADKRTDKQVADAFGPFNANAGTYEIKGNEITAKRMVAKNPATMKAGNFEVDTFRLEGKDTLWVTAKATGDGPVQNPTTIKYIRIE